MNWKSNYKIPLSFIIFFVLVFFLLGEQLPALPLYIGGPNGDADKVHILDLRPTDALHRPLVYVLIGIVNWFLLRKFSWPVVWVIGGVLAVLDQLFLTPIDHRAQYTGLFGLVMVIATIIFMWSLLTLVPYFIYKKVDQKWGKIGRWKAILIVLVVNLLLLGFFYFQIYVLRHSYRNLIKQGQGTSQNDQRNNCQPGNPNNGPDCPK